MSSVPIRDSVDIAGDSQQTLQFVDFTSTAVIILSKKYLVM